MKTIMYQSVALDSREQIAVCGVSDDPDSLRLPLVPDPVGTPDTNVRCINSALFWERTRPPAAPPDRKWCVASSL